MELISQIHARDGMIKELQGNVIDKEVEIRKLAREAENLQKANVQMMRQLHSVLALKINLASDQKTNTFAVFKY
jgi:protein subunit release factor B